MIHLEEGSGVWVWMPSPLENLNRELLDLLDEHSRKSYHEILKIQGRESEAVDVAGNIIRSNVNKRLLDLKKRALCGALNAQSRYHETSRGDSPEVKRLFDEVTKFVEVSVACDAELIWATVQEVLLKVKGDAKTNPG